MEVSRKKQTTTVFFSQNGAKHTHFKKPWFGSEFSIRMVISVGIAGAFLELGSYQRFPPDPGWGEGADLEGGGEGRT